MTKKEYESRVRVTLSYFEKAHIALTDEEKRNIEVSDFGKGDIENLGLQLLVYVNTDRVCAKEMVLTPGQTCPEHKHVPANGHPGKEETFRCRYGTVYLYVPGEDNTERDEIELPSSTVTVFHKIILHPGEQYTLVPETRHWFRAGDEGAVISEFSTRSTDETDVFTDPLVVRHPAIEG